MWLEECISNMSACGPDHLAIDQLFKGVSEHMNPARQVVTTARQKTDLLSSLLA